MIECKKNRDECVEELFKHGQDGDEFDFFGRKVRIIDSQVYENELPGIMSYRFTLNDGNTLRFMVIDSED